MKHSYLKLLGWGFPLISFYFGSQHNPFENSTKLYPEKESASVTAGHNLVLLHLSDGFCPLISKVIKMKCIFIFLLDKSILGSKIEGENHNIISVIPLSFSLSDIHNKFWRREEIVSESQFSFEMCFNFLGRNETFFSAAFFTPHQDHSSVDSMLWTVSKFYILALVVN